MTTATTAQLNYIAKCQAEAQAFLAESGETLDNVTAESVRAKSVTAHITEGDALSAWRKANPPRNFADRAAFKAAFEEAKPGIIAAEWERQAAKRRAYIAAAYAPTEGITKEQASAILDVIG